MLALEGMLNIHIYSIIQTLAINYFSKISNSAASLGVAVSMPLNC